MIIVTRTDHTNVTLIHGDSLTFSDSLMFVLNKNDIPIYMIPLVNVFDVELDYEKPVEIEETTKKE